MRAFRPGGGAGRRASPSGGERRAARSVHPAGLFEGDARGRELPLRYQLEVDYGDAGSSRSRTRTASCRRSASSTCYLLGEGRHEELWERLGAHVREVDGVTGTAFAVWAPSARAVSVVGDFNYWDGRLHPMRSLGASGIWELFLPGVAEGRATSTRSAPRTASIRLKADPFAFETEVPPQDGVGRHDRRATSGRDDGVAGAARASASRCAGRCRSTRSTSAPGG